MSRLAYALVMAMEYLNVRNDEDFSEDDDCGVLEALAYELQNASPAEQELIKQAAHTLADEEAAKEQPDGERLADYRNFVEEYIDPGDDDDDAFEP